MKKLKVEFCDGNGEQVTVAFSGQFTKERILQLIDLFSPVVDQHNIASKSNITRTLKDKIEDIIREKFNNFWFTSKDILTVYEEKYQETIKLSTISTYLTRLYTNGYLERKGNRSCWQYRPVMPLSTPVEKFVDDLKQK